MTLSIKRKKSPLDDASLTVVPPGPGWYQFFVSAAALVGVLGVGWYLAGILIEKTNQNLGPTKDALTGEIRGDQDQKHNLNRSLLARQYLQPDPALGLSQNFVRSLPHDTDGVVAPLWPWVASRFADPQHIYNEGEVSGHDRAFFVKGKWINVTIVLVFVWALGLVVARTFRPSAAIAVILLGTFGVLLPRAVYFQPEPIYFILFFLSWICAIRLLFRNDLWLYVVFAILTGLAYLAKTSIEPLVMAWFGAMGLRWLHGCFHRGEPEAGGAWSCRNHFLGTVVFALVWLAVCGPRYEMARQRWADPRHSYPAYWMWMDDFGTAYRWMNEHRDVASLEAIPQEERPSLSRYRQTHTPEQMRERLAAGVIEKVTRLVAPKRVKPKRDGTFSGWKHILDRRGVYLGAMAGIMLVAGGIAMGHRRALAERPSARLPSGTFAVVAFVLVATLGYTAAYGWYTPIGRGDRFMLSLYLPLVFSFIWGAESLMNIAVMRRSSAWWSHLYSLLLWGLNAAIIWRLVIVLRLPVFDPNTQ